MMQVREALAAGLSVPALELSGRAALCLACARYLLFSLDRLHAQDQRIQDLLTDRLPESEVQARRQVAEVHEQQRQTRSLVEALRRHVGEFRDPEPGLRAFLAGFQALVQPRRNPLSPHTDRLFGDADWAQVADVTPATLAEEERLFQAVRDCAPPGADPEQFSGQHSPAMAPAPRASL